MNDEYNIGLESNSNDFINHIIWIVTKKIEF